MKFKTLYNDLVLLNVAQAQTETESGIILGEQERQDHNIGTVELVSPDLKDVKIKKGDKVMFRVVSTVMKLEGENQDQVIVQYRDLVGKM